MKKHIIIFQTAIYAMVGALSLLVSGCGPIYSNVIDPLIPKKPVPAEYNLSNQKILIWIEIGNSNMKYGQVRRMLTEAIAKELHAHQAVGQTIPYRQIIQLRLSPELTSMNIDDLGRNSDADAVLYILINQLTLKHESTDDIFDSSMNGYCKIVETDSGQRVWPNDTLYRTFKIRGRFTTEDSPDLNNQLLEELCKKTAKQLTLYFYEHKK